MSKYYNLYKLIVRQPKFFDVLNEAAVPSFEPEAKDIDRINSLVAKAGGDSNKEFKLAKKMAMSIKGIEKMVRRFRASFNITGPDSECTKVFAAAISGLNYDDALQAFLAGNEKAFDIKRETGFVEIPVNNQVSSPEEVTEEPKVKTRELTPERLSAIEKTKLAKAAAAKLNQDLDSEDDEYISIGTPGNTVFDNIDLESLQKLNKLQAYYAGKLKEYNLQEKLQKVADEYKDEQKKYNISKLVISNFTINGKLIVDTEVIHKTSPKKNNGWFKQECSIASSVSSIEYNIFTDEWNFDKARGRQYEIINGRHATSDRYSNSSKSFIDAVMPMTRSFQKKLKAFFKANKYINTILERFKNAAVYLYNDEYYNSEEINGFTSHVRFPAHSMSKMTQIAEYIINRIDDKFDYSDEADNNPDEWPGYYIAGITNGNVVFGARRNTRGQKWEGRGDRADKIKDMLIDIGCKNIKAPTRFGSNYEFAVPIDELIEILK